MDVDTAEEKKDSKDESRPSDKDTTPGLTFDVNAKDATPSSTRKNPPKERVGYEIETMSRVLPPQLKYISFAHERYKPVKKVNILSTLPIVHPVSMIALTLYHWSQPTGGVILLQDLQPGETKQLLELKVKKTPPTPAPAPGRTVGTTGEPVDEPVTPEGDQTLATRTAADILRELAPGAEAAAGVLTAVDEDEEGVEEALAPREFEYDTDEMEE
jgi:26S proteasome regulatory subunit N2